MHPYAQLTTMEELLKAAQDNVASLLSELKSSLKESEFQRGNANGKDAHISSLQNGHEWDSNSHGHIPEIHSLEPSHSFPHVLSRLRLKLICSGLTWFAFHT
jgi:hypothetical protein